MDHRQLEDLGLEEWRQIDGRSWDREENDGDRQASKTTEQRNLGDYFQHSARTLLKSKLTGDVPGSLVVKRSASTAGGMSSTLEDPACCSADKI